MPQSGRSSEEKDEFFEELEDMIGIFPIEKNLIVVADSNEHVGKNSDGFQRIHGGKGFGSRNKEG